MRSYNFDALFCAHNPSLEKGKPQLEQKLQYLEDIVGRVQKLRSTGLSENEVIKSMDPKKDRWVKLMTMGNVSFVHMVRSAYRDDIF